MPCEAAKGVGRCNRCLISAGSHLADTSGAEAGGARARGNHRVLRQHAVETTWRSLKEI
jgi:hypothetical protein